MLLVSTCHGSPPRHRFSHLLFTLVFYSLNVLRHLARHETVPFFFLSSRAVPRDYALSFPVRLTNRYPAGESRTGLVSPFGNLLFNEPALPTTRGTIFARIVVALVIRCLFTANVRVANI